MDMYLSARCVCHVQLRALRRLAGDEGPGAAIQGLHFTEDQAVRMDT
jgi:hypothetical protein